MLYVDEHKVKLTVILDKFFTKHWNILRYGEVQDEWGETTYIGSKSNMAYKEAIEAIEDLVSFEIETVLDEFDAKNNKK